MNYSVSPWVRGTRADAYRGYVEARSSASDALEGLRAALDDLEAQAKDRDCNWLVALEITCDPWSEHGYDWYLYATAALLRKMT